MMKNTLDSLNAYRNALSISDLSWRVFERIPRHNYSTAMQFLDAADSIGANIAEGYGRGTYRDRKHFLNISRGSLYEASYWLDRLVERNLIDAHLAGQLHDLLKQQGLLISGYIRYLKSKIPP